MLLIIGNSTGANTGMTFDNLTVYIVRHFECAVLVLQVKRSPKACQQKQPLRFATWALPIPNSQQPQRLMGWNRSTTKTIAKTLYGTTLKLYKQFI